MRKRIVFGSGVLLLTILVALVVWQGSFSFGIRAGTAGERHPIGLPDLLPMVHVSCRASSCVAPLACPKYFEPA